MYHPDVVSRRIEAAVASGEVYYELTAADGRRTRRHFQPTYHSVSEVDASVNHLRELFDEEAGQTKRPLEESEIAFIANERLLCRLDYRYYAGSYCWIKDEEGRNVRYAPRVPQKIFQDVVAEHDLQGWPIELQVLKARQLGLSREISLMFGHRSIFWAGVNAVLASADPGKSALLADMMEYPIDRLPWWLAPMPTARRSGEYIEYGQQDSKISIESGNQFHGIARGSTPTCVHLSELCEYEDPEELVEASLFPAIHPSRWTFLVLESTALGRGNWWHETWKVSKEGWHEGRSRLRPVFLPWFTGSDIYPKKDWVRMKREHIDRFNPSESVLHHAKAAEAFVESDPLLRKYLGAGWRMSKEQMFWYETKRDEYRDKGILNKFLAEYCSSSEESFQSTNISVFDTDDIIWYRATAKQRQPLGVFGLVAKEEIFPKRLQPSVRDIDPDMPKIDLAWPWGAGPMNFTLEPLKWSGYGDNDQNGLGKIFIFEMPEARSIYGFGVDTGDGVGKDRSVVQVMRKGNMFGRSAQVAEYANPYVNSHDLWPIAAALAVLYASPSQGGMLRQPRGAIECRGNGDTVQHEMMKRGYHNFHPWVRIDTRNIQPGKAHKIGVFTSSWFRKQIMDWLLVFLRDRKMDINSPYLVGEMETLEADEYSQALKAAWNEHDDRLMALGFIIVSMHQLEIMRGQGPEDQQNERDEADPVFESPFRAAAETARLAMLAKMGAGSRQRIAR